jgi:hypothetical protein
MYSRVVANLAHLRCLAQAWRAAPADPAPVQKGVNRLMMGADAQARLVADFASALSGTHAARRTVIRSATGTRLAKRRGRAFRQ